MPHKHDKKCSPTKIMAQIQHFILGIFQSCKMPIYHISKIRKFIYLLISLKFTGIIVEVASLPVLVSNLA